MVAAEAGVIFSTIPVAMIRKLKIFYHHFMAVGYETHTDNIAVKHVLALAKLDDCWGLNELGYRFSTGKSVKKDQEKAIFYYKRAFEKNGKEALYAAANLGSAYLNGEGVPKNDKKAIKWFKIAAELGHPESQYNYGLSLIDGWVGKANNEEGVYWLKKAAASDLTEAKDSLVKLKEKI